MRLKIILLTGLGFIFLGLGAMGLLLPVWPTTPFVLLSVACFSSAPHIKARIMKNSFFKEHIENYEHRTGLSKKTVWISLVWLWSMLIVSMMLTQSTWVSVLLLLIGSGVTSHILWIARTRGRKKDDIE
ncbi:MAG TPA: YbaN family protein [Clostridia bacterium]|nr:YbaN family protein [Clostridia bacterium]